MQYLLSTLSFVIFLLFNYTNSNTELSKSKEISVCHSLPSDMSAFVSDPAFVNMHPSPKIVTLLGIGQMVSFATTDGKDASAYLIKAKGKSSKWLFVYQEWWGLNDNIKAEAEKYFNDLGGKVNVIALDMYDGKSATDPAEAGKLMQGADQNRLASIIKGAYTFAGQKAKVASVGWCFGGGLSLKSAIAGGKNNVGSVMYYGMPVKDVEQLKTLTSDVLGLFATEQWISKEIVEEFAANMKLANKKLTYKIFPGVHGFANPSNPKYDKENADIAYGMSLSYLKSKFKV